MQSSQAKVAVKIAAAKVPESLDFKGFQGLPKAHYLLKKLQKNAVYELFEDKRKSPATV